MAIKSPVEESIVDSDEETVVVEEPEIKALEPLRKLPELKIP